MCTGIDWATGFYGEKIRGSDQEGRGSWGIYWWSSTTVSI